MEEVNMNYKELYQPAHTIIGKGCIQEIPRYIDTIAGNKALVVTDEGLYKIGTVKKVTDVLDRAGKPYALYTGVKPNPTVSLVNEAKAVYDREGCDYLIGIGGGSPLDVSKAISILAKNGGNIEDYNGLDKSKKSGVPLIAINTTAGTGSEVTRAYVVTDEVRKVKMLMVDAHCLSYLALNDPALMVDMPAPLTAATGMDALTHAVEAYVAKSHFPFTDGLALEAIGLVAKSLQKACENGRDMDARTDMCWAEYMAGLAFSNAGLGINHSMAHTLGGHFHIPHGRANALVLPYVIEFNADMAREGAKHSNDAAKKYQKMARIVGLPAPTPKVGVANLIAEIQRLLKYMDRPQCMSECGVSVEEFNKHREEIVRRALADACTQANPRKVTAEDINKILDHIAK